MKKRLFLLVAFVPSLVLAQLKVDSNGNVGIGSSGTSYSSNFSVGCNGETGVGSKFEGIGTIVKVSSTEGAGYFSSKPALVVNSESGSVPDNITGISSVANTTCNYSSSWSVGVAGQGYNVAGTGIGVSGHVILSNKAAGVFGDVSNYTPTYSVIDGRYAGFFYGNVKVTNGTINGTLTNSSDERLKEDVEEIADTERGEDGSVISKLELLTPVSYRYKDMNAGKERGTYVDKDGKEVELPEEKPSQVMTKRHFGFVAQELQQVYPDLVYENDNGYLSVNYTELIPILVQSIKELKSEIDELKAVASKENGSTLTNGAQETLSLPHNQGQGTNSSMDQNVPNPFTEKTDVAIYLPESVREATLYIYDLSGKQLEQHPVEGRGETVMTIHADKMDAGMYVYSLIANKKVVTTKKMIVVK